MDELCGAPVDKEGMPVPCENTLPCIMHPYQIGSHNDINPFFKGCVVAVGLIAIGLLVIIVVGGILFHVFRN